MVSFVSTLNLLILTHAIRYIIHIEQSIRMADADDSMITESWASVDGKIYYINRYDFGEKCIYRVDPFAQSADYERTKPESQRVGYRDLTRVPLKQVLAIYAVVWIESPQSLWVKLGMPHDDFRVWEFYPDSSGIFVKIKWEENGIKTIGWVTREDFHTKHRRWDWEICYSAREQWRRILED